MDEQTRLMWEMRPGMEKRMYDLYRIIHTQFGPIKMYAEKEYLELREEFDKYFEFGFSPERYAALHRLYNPADRNKSKIRA